MSEERVALEPAAPQQAEPGVGEILARARESQGLSLAEVAQQLKFALRQLEALEQERFDALSGGTFARGMVRGYARLLKLDAEPLLERIADRFDAPDSSRLAARFHEPVPFSDSSKRGNLVYAVLSLAVLAAVAAVAFEWQQERAAARLTFVPAARVPLEPPRVATAAPVPVQIAEPPAALEPPPPAPGIGRIEVRCERESWIEIKDAAGRTLLSQLNAAGCEMTVEGKPPFALVIGNAQHVRLAYNARPIDLMPYVKVEVARFTLE